MKTSDTRPTKAGAWIVLICAAACITASVAAVASMGAIYGIAPEPGDVLAYLYQINAIFCLFAAVFAVAVLFKKRHRGVLAKCMLWGMLILSVMYVTPFVTDTLGYLGAMAFLAAFRYACAYLPFFALIAAIIAVLTTWRALSHRTASVVAMVCSLAAVFCGVVYLWQVGPALAEASAAYDTAQIWAIITGVVTAIAVQIVLWFCTLTEQIWRRFMMTGSEQGSSGAYRREVRPCTVQTAALEQERGPEEGQSSEKLGGEPEDAGEQSAPAAEPGSGGLDESAQQTEAGGSGETAQDKT